MKNRYDSVAKLTVYKGPLIMLHGTTDNLIPIEHAEKLYASAATNRKHIFRVDGLGHNDRLPARMLQEIVAKVDELTAPATQ